MVLFVKSASALEMNESWNYYMETIFWFYENIVSVCFYAA